MANSNAQITSPVRWARKGYDQWSDSGAPAGDDLMTVLNLGTATSTSIPLQSIIAGSSGTGNTRIKEWARYKPTTGGCISNRKKADGTNESEAIICGLAEYDNQGDIEVRDDAIPSVTSENFSSDLVWSLRPHLKYMRIQDFNGYDHNAEPNWECPSMFPSSTRGKQEGFFYNELTLTAAVRRKSGSQYVMYTTKPVQCWEDRASGATYYGSLFLEEILSAQDAYDWSDYKIGIAIDINGSRGLWISTGQSVSSMIVNVQTGVVDLNITASGTTYLIGRIMKYNVTDKHGFDLYLDFNEINKAAGDNVLRLNSHPESITIQGARLVLCNTASSNVILNTSGDFYSMRSFEIESGFGKADNLTLKKLVSYIDITEKTNRGTTPTERNAARYFYTNDSSEYVYQNGDWAWVGQGHPEYQLGSGCNMEVDSNIWYPVYGGSGVAYISEFSTTTPAASYPKYYRFRLQITGYYCCELRTSSNTLADIAFWNRSDTSQETIIKTAKVQFFCATDNLTQDDDAVIQFGTGNNISETYTFKHNTLYDIGERDMFVWSYDHYYDSSEGQIQYRRTAGATTYKTFNRNYGSASGSLDKCYSEMKDLSYITYTTKGGTSITGRTNTNDGMIYIYVKASKLSNPNDFIVQMKYNGIDADSLVTWKDSTDPSHTDDSILGRGTLPTP